MVRDPNNAESPFVFYFVLSPFLFARCTGCRPHHAAADALLLAAQLSFRALCSGAGELRAAHRFDSGHLSDVLGAPLNSIAPMTSRSPAVNDGWRQSGTGIGAPVGTLAPRHIRAHQSRESIAARVFLPRRRRCRSANQSFSSATVGRRATGKSKCNIILPPSALTGLAGGDAPPPPPSASPCPTPKYQIQRNHHVINQIQMIFTPKQFSRCQCQKKSPPPQKKQSKQKKVCAFQAK